MNCPSNLSNFLDISAEQCWLITTLPLLAGAMLRSSRLSTTTWTCIPTPLPLHDTSPHQHPARHWSLNSFSMQKMLASMIMTTWKSLTFQMSFSAYSCVLSRSIVGDSSLPKLLMSTANHHSAFFGALPCTVRSRNVIRARCWARSKRKKN